MIKQLLRLGTRFVIRNEVFEIAHVDHSSIRYCSTNGGRPRTIPVLSFWQLEEEGVVGLLGDAVRADNIGDQLLGLHQLSDDQFNAWNRQMKYVKSMFLCRLEPHSKENRRRTIERVAAETSDPKPPSPPTLSRWATAFTRSGGNAKVLVPRHDRKGPRYTKLPLEMEHVVGLRVREDYVEKAETSGAAVHANITGHLQELGLLNASLKAPSKATIYRRISSIDPYVIDHRRHGKRYADGRHRAAGQSWELSRPMEATMVDGHIIDVLIVDAETGEVLGRPYLVCLFDVYTRCVIGWYISLMPFCATTVLAAIKHACSRAPEMEPGGVPERIIPDNGRDLASMAMRLFCTALFIEIMPAKAYCPDDKAHLERFFRTFNMQVAHLLPGTTFSNPTERGEYDSHKMACCTLGELRDIFDKWLRTVYEVRIHSSTKRAPGLDWRDSQVQWPIAHHSLHELDVIARVTHSRKINNGRVLVDHLYYKSDALAALEVKGLRDVKVGVDELNLSYVFVAHPSDPLIHIRADACKAKYAHQLTQYEHDEVKKRLAEQTKKDLAELGEYAYEIARWELWKTIHAIKNTRSSKRLTALREQRHAKAGQFPDADDVVQSSTSSAVNRKKAGKSSREGKAKQVSSVAIAEHHIGNELTDAPQLACSNTFGLIEI
jgi:putative transposase